MRILFIAMSDSIHTARWINQIADLGWDIHLFPSIDYGATHPDLKNVSIYHSTYGIKKNDNPHVVYHGHPGFSSALAWIARKIMERISPDYRANQLKKLISELKPDIIHSMEFQAAGYLTLKVKKMYPDKFPLWIATNWGSDLYYFSRFPEHKEKIKEILEQCDYYSCECKRDILLAKKIGLTAETLPLLPAAGGFDFEYFSHIQKTMPPSNRKLILIKGYQGWAGRALIGLEALKLCSSQLKGYTIAFYLASPDFIPKIEEFSKEISVPIKIIPYCSHEEMLEFFGQARIHIGLSISDGTPNTMMEAMIMGAFPIQSDTSCADEWIENGTSGFIVPPEDPEIIASALCKAIIDDDLVDHAAQINEETTKKNLDFWVIRQKVIDIYTKLVTDKS